MKLKIRKDKWILKNRGERGFTLISLVGFVVGAGLAGGAAMQGADAVTNWQYDQFYKELRNVESDTWAYRERHGRWPGDCDKDGVIGFVPPTAAQLNADQGAMPSNNAGPAATCASTHAETLETVVGELQSAGLVSQAQAGGKNFAHMFDESFEIGHAELTNASNVIVAYGVSNELAQWLDKQIDGTPGGESGRLRRWDQNPSGSAWATQKGETVAVAYFFDQKLPK